MLGVKAVPEALLSMKLIPDEMGERDIWLLVLLFIVVAVTLVVLSRVFWTIFLAVAIAYILYPFKRRISERGFTDRQSAALVTGLSSILAVSLLVPLLVVLFQRRNILMSFIADLPGETTLEVMEFSYTVHTTELESFAQQWITNTAVKTAESLPYLSIKLFLFIFILYAVLRHPDAIKSSILGIFPDSMRDILRSYNQRIEKTLVGIFAVQTITSVLTFIIALPVFYFLGYKAFFSLAVISAILQFIPIVGPAMIIIALAGLELMAGLYIKALTILVLGMVIIGFLPDAYLRPRLAGRTTDLPASLYFVGFAGGALTLGPVGILAGPLSIAVLLETIELLLSE